MSSPPSAGRTSIISNYLSLFIKTTEKLKILFRIAFRYLLEFVMFNKKFLISVSFILVLSGLYCSKKQHFELSRFISAETCGGCHSEIYSQWINSMHNQSHKDIIYNKVAAHFLKGLTDPDEIKEAESCIKCHTPVGVLTGFPKKTSDDLSKTPEIAKQGIQCDYCHSSTGTFRSYNNGLKLDPGHGDENPGIKRGPFKDSKSDYHHTEYSKFHTKAEICGNCHDVRHVVFETKLETTYEEWKNSPYNTGNKNHVNCQGCHMYQRPGIPATGATKRPENPGTATSGGIKRKHIFTHYFVGANAYMPGLNDDSVKKQMAEDRLKNSAELSIDDLKIRSGILFLSVKNTGAGHYLPTGLTDTRQMWLEIIVKSSEKVIYSSGKTDKNGYITKGTVIYNTVFGDGKGKPVTNIAKAREILKDYRVPPQKKLTETIKLPEGKFEALQVNVRLLYRSASQKTVDTVFEKGKHRLPVIVMEQISKTIKL